MNRRRAPTPKERAMGCWFCRNPEGELVEIDGYPYCAKCRVRWASVIEATARYLRERQPEAGDWQHFMETGRWPRE